MASARIKIPGVAGQIEAKAAKVHNAVMAELQKLAESRRPKPKPAKRRTFAHIKDYRTVIR
jgi:hypothetical protein